MALTQTQEITNVRLDREADAVTISTLTRYFDGEVEITARLDHKEYLRADAQALADAIANEVEVFAFMGW